MVLTVTGIIRNLSEREDKERGEVSDSLNQSISKASKILGLTPLEIPKSWRESLIRISTPDAFIPSVNKVSKKVLDISLLEIPKNRRELPVRVSTLIDVSILKESIPAEGIKEYDEKRFSEEFPNRSFFVNNIKPEDWSFLPVNTAVLFYSESQTLIFSIKISEDTRGEEDISHIDKLGEEVTELLLKNNIQNPRPVYIYPQTIAPSWVEKLLQKPEVEIGTYTIYKYGENLFMIAFKVGKDAADFRVHQLSCMNKKEELSWLSPVRIVIKGSVHEFDTLMGMFDYLTQGLEKTQLYKYSKNDFEGYGWDFES